MVGRNGRMVAKQITKYLYTQKAVKTRWSSAPTWLRVYSGQTRGLLRLNSEFTPTKPKSPFLGRFRALSVIFRIMKIVDTS